MSPPPSAPGFLQVLTANDLVAGDVVFLGARDWVADIGDALVAATPEEAARLEARGAEARTGSGIVDPYLVAVAMSADGVPQPLHFRERLRTRGPTVRPDLGKQAAFSQAKPG